MKVLSGRSSNPTSGESFLLRSFTFTATLRWTGKWRLITEVGLNPKLVPFSLLANLFHLLFWNCKCTEKRHIRRLKIKNPN